VATRVRSTSCADFAGAVVSSHNGEGVKKHARNWKAGSGSELIRSRIKNPGKGTKRGAKTPDLGSGQRSGR